MRNYGKNQHKPLVERTICRSCPSAMPESAASKRPNIGPNRHMKGPNIVAYLPVTTASKEARTFAVR